MSSESGQSPAATCSPHEQEIQQLRERLATLEKNESQFRKLADNIPQLAWIADENGCIFWYNRRWYDYTGTTLAEMEGWGWRKVHHPGHVTRVVDRITRSFQTGEPWEDIFPLRSRSGEYRWFLSRAMPIRDGQGKILWWFGTNTDVTAQRDTEQALRESERELAATFEQAFVGIVHVDLIRHADAAMYHAKESGRNRIEFFNEDIQRGLQRSLNTEQRLRRALSRGEFALHYQPIVSTRGGRLDGMEALIRWQPAEADALGPTEFIPIAETSGLINSLGEWAMREACRQHEVWRSQGLPPLRVAVNVSPVQFRSKDFLVGMERLVRETGIDPACLEIELTEGTIMKHVEEAARTLGALNDLGVSISLDDFGTGYSSLNYLSILPIDKIKVDRSFIINIERDRRLLVITEAMIALAKKLGVKVVAEGIESPAALDLLRERGCDLGQGYLLGRPLPVDAVTGWFREHVTSH